MIFEDLGLSSIVLKAVNELGYTQPTPIQMQAIPCILGGKDLLGSAQTGTGKTAAFILPIIDILSSGRSRARMPRAVILVPTRELAVQVGDNFKDYARYSKLSSVFLIGGSSMVEQEKQLARGADVLVATPGRLLDFIGRGKILLNDVKILIIDEADRMLDMGFIPDVDKIVATLPAKRQTALLSATMAPAIRKLASVYLSSPEEVSVSPPSTTAMTVTQRWIQVDSKRKKEILEHVLRLQESPKAVVFCNRKRDIQAIVTFLHKHGLSAQAMHGDMPQDKRNKVLAAFRTKDLQVLVASDVAARGLDIDDVSLVVNFDVPQHAEDYVHRIGRTGRAGRSGMAVTFVTGTDEDFMKEIQKITKTPIELGSLSHLYQELKGDLTDFDSSLDDREAFAEASGKGRGRRGTKSSKKQESSSSSEKTLSKKGSKKSPSLSSCPSQQEVSLPLKETEGLEQEKKFRAKKSVTRKERCTMEETHALENFKSTPSAVVSRSYRLETQEDKDPKIIGFGDHLPAFLARPLPASVLKRTSRP